MVRGTEVLTGGIEETVICSGPAGRAEGLADTGSTGESTVGRSGPVGGASADGAEACIQAREVEAGSAAEGIEAYLQAKDVSPV